MTEIEIVGPKVSVDRGGTSDAGAGQLVLKGGKLLVRASHIERELGALAAISDVSIVDLARTTARLRFVDGVTWNVATEGGESIYEFLQQIERASGRPGLVPPPPRFSQAVREAATPQRRRWAGMTVVALLLFFPVRMLAGMSASLGHGVAVVALVLLGLVVAAIAVREGGPPFLEGVRSRLSKLGPVPVVALLVAIAAGSAMGAGDAETRAEQEAEKAERIRRAEARAQAEAERLAKVQAKKQEQVDAAVAALDAALAAKKYREAREAREVLRGLAPEHPALEKGGAELEGAIAKVTEEDRVAGLSRGLRAVRRMARDRLRCEDAKRVSDAWKQLDAVRSTDAEYEQVARAVPVLERCRKRVVARFAVSAEDGLRRQRMQIAPALESQLRGLGYAASVTLEGKGLDRLVIRADELDKAAVARITALTDAQGKAFLDKRAAEGVRVVLFKGARRFEKRFQVEPPDARELTAPLLERFGLAQELALGAPPPADPEATE